MLQLSTEMLYWSLVALTANTICVMHGAWTRRTTHANAGLQYLMDGYGEKVLKKQMQNKATHLKDSKKWQEDQSLHDASHITTPVQISP